MRNHVPAWSVRSVGSVVRNPPAGAIARAKIGVGLETTDLSDLTDHGGRAGQAGRPASAGAPEHPRGPVEAPGAASAGQGGALAAALALARRGARVLPLAERGKVPLCPHGCRDATTDAATIRRWFERWPAANLGIATGGALLVVDVDPRHGGDASLADLPGLPATREGLTGGAGRHLWFRGEARCSAGRLGPGLDVRGKGGYVVAPPSLHPSGGRYSWHPTRGLGYPIAAAPGWLLERLADRPRPAPPPSFDPTPDLGRRIERARRYLGRVPGAIAGQGGHAATFRVALAMVRGFDLPEDVAYGLLAEWNQRCEPPWSERELRHKIADAVRSNVDAGYLLRRGAA